LVVVLVPGQQKILQELKKKRELLSNEVADLINTFGPRMYQDFDQVDLLSSHD
jgi:glycerol-3-phosphate O-acyltransferase/dihydroxyacetone phosphate acyltransferase